MQKILNVMKMYIEILMGLPIGNLKVNNFVRQLYRIKFENALLKKEIILL